MAGRKTDPKPDDRRDNVDRIEYNIGQTIKNIELANEMIDETDDSKTREDLIEKNKRREESLSNMRNEIRDEAIAKEKGYPTR